MVYDVSDIAQGSEADLPHMEYNQIFGFQRDQMHWYRFSLSQAISAIWNPLAAPRKKRIPIVQMTSWSEGTILMMTPDDE
jgi:hypothetical protein